MNPSDWMAVRSARHGVVEVAAPIRVHCAGLAELAIVGFRWSVTRNGMIIEQAQILTTDNLATLVGPVGLRAVISDWPDLARRSAEHVMALVRRVERNPRALRTIKDAAYAWRQMVFYLSLIDPAEYDAFTAGTARALQGEPAHVEMRLRPALDGLRHVMNGGTLDPAGGANGRRFQGWVVGRHWMLAHHASDDGRTSAVS